MSPAETWNAEDAVEQLYAAHWRTLVRLAVLLLRDQGAAEEVLQDAFVAMHGRWSRLRDPDKALASADANCSPLGWPGVKGHTVNYLFEDLIPDLRKSGVAEATITRLFVDNPADFLTIQQ